MADAKQFILKNGDIILIKDETARNNIETLEQSKIDKPTTNGTEGQSLMLNDEGEIVWGNAPSIGDEIKYDENNEGLYTDETLSDVRSVSSSKINTAYNHASDLNKLNTAQSEGLYKISTTAEGHIKSVNAVTKNDITNLGIPAQDTTYNAATTSIDGLMSASDKNKLDSIDSGAQVNVVTSVAGKTGDITLLPSDVGLGNVGNFKAVSTVANQGLTDTEKANARTNIGAGTSNFSGSYNDLLDKPTIPTANNGTLTIQKNGTTIGTFSANQNTDTTINISIPTASEVGAVPASDFSKVYTSEPTEPTAGTMWVTTS